MKTAIFDLESNGLLPEVTTIHCISIKDFETGQMYSFRSDDKERSIEAGLKILSEAKTIVGHNIIDYDLRAIKKLYPTWSYDGSVRDTLLLSKLVFSDIKEKDMVMFKRGKLSGKLIGRYSLKAFGERMGLLKGDYGETSNWTTLDSDMVSYCELDVEITARLYDKCIREQFLDEVIELEQEAHRICLEQTMFGFPFNRNKAKELEMKLVSRKAELSQELLALCNRGWYTCLGIKIPTRSVKYKDILRGNETEGCAYSKIKYIDFNPNSRAHLSKILQSKFGWKPTEFGADGNATINEETLRTLKHPIVEQINEYLTLEKRLGQLSSGNQAWLLLEKEGKLHGRIDTLGAVTSRCTHSNPNLAQIPSNAAPYGSDCRSLFVADKNWKLFGSDCQGLELRMLAHYMARYDAGAYGKIILEGDIHSHNQHAAGLETRNQAKTMIYCYLYGGGNEKLAEVINGNKADGARLRANLLKGLPALKSLGDAVSTRAKEGKIKGLDGRVLPVRHQHAALNSLLQSAGAITTKRWMVKFHEIMNKELRLTHGVEYKQYAFIHDELVIGFDPTNITAEQLGDISRRAVQTVGEGLNLRIPLDIDWKVGDDYSEIH